MDLKNLDVNDTCIFEDVRSYLRKIHTALIDGKWVADVKRKKISSLFKTIDFDSDSITLPIFLNPKIQKF